MSAEQAVGRADDPYTMHIISRAQAFLENHGVTARYLCGVRATGPDAPDPGEDGLPLCSRCAQIAGYSPDEIARGIRVD